jgi:hypothetical protein
VELLICFECGQVYGYSGEDNAWKVSTSTEPAKLFNDVLKKAGVPLAEPPSSAGNNKLE